MSRSAQHRRGGFFARVELSVHKEFAPESGMQSGGGTYVVIMESEVTILAH